MHKRINVTLPVETIGLIERVTSKGNRSRFIDQAVHHYVDTMGRAGLRRRLEEGARAQAERDLRLAEEWFPVEEAMHGDSGE